MGTLAKTLGVDASVDVGGMRVAVKQLCIDELFAVMREAFLAFDEREKPVDIMAQEAIETGKIPLTSVSILIAKACPDLDEDDVKTLLSGRNIEKALEIAAVAMGNEVADSDEASKAENKARAKKK